ncbi:hypothetical protein [Leptolyngbya sp. FACHB-261]|uniref:hypothetical protein n=1 Tax=Leptolyngbya sp. FACHB-261 TaxID=2692806 RepID=UPI0016882B3C|nr:hypothetical protein [Leptolyngbya sp. FACHB-261]MBD2104772.1 hypothetical protein [Leptolyngbya sp. FACHB-261]
MSRSINAWTDLQKWPEEQLEQMGERLSQLERITANLATASQDQQCRIGVLEQP